MGSWDWLEGPPEAPKPSQGSVMDETAAAVLMIILEGKENKMNSAFLTRNYGVFLGNSQLTEAPSIT